MLQYVPVLAKPAIRVVFSFFPRPIRSDLNLVRNESLGAGLHLESMLADIKQGHRRDAEEKPAH